MSERQESRRGVEGRNKKVSENLGLVGAVVKQLWSIRAVRRMGYEDAFQSGVLGLMRAADLWDEERHFRFSTYATPAIRNRILSDSTYSGIIHVPQWVYNPANWGRVLPDNIKRDMERALSYSALPAKSRRSRGTVTLRDENHRALTVEDSSTLEIEDEVLAIIKEVRSYPRAQAAAAERCLVNGETVREVSEEAGVSIKAVRQALDCAKVRLRKWAAGRRV